jgi:hypothetical protein
MAAQLAASQEGLSSMSEWVSVWNYDCHSTNSYSQSALTHWNTQRVCNCLKTHDYKICYKMLYFQITVNEFPWKNIDATKKGAAFAVSERLFDHYCTTLTWIHPPQYIQLQFIQCAYFPEFGIITRCLSRLCSLAYIAVKQSYILNFKLQ